MRYTIILFVLVIFLLSAACSGSGDFRPEIKAGGTWSMGVGGRLGKF